MAYDLYVVTDEKISGGVSHARIAELSYAGGADCVQLRDKNFSYDELMPVADEICAVRKKYGGLFFVDDNIDAAIDSGADGVHIGQGDMPLSEAREVSPKGFLIGVSVGNLKEALFAERGGADYIALSPTFDTLSKPDAGRGNGISELRKICENVSVPVIGIGGICMSNIEKVILAGADGCAVISAVVSKKDITCASKELKAEIVRAKKLHKNFV
ncbi:thiamine-phosphate pyrophosphorylase [Methanomicrobium sp. W14]|jgi:thiamine-phosphate pyrophosphorylase|uniref:thiamine phosphate synthase n=1 Tax=Methanomicrobium sp. W14 TaxID=2817839 RepID=UPI001AE0F880|nr:thiamine phosphate synthase [Methanomicrobium sp. W14]MBP2133353.1 thiamine-phosphate pyrophosphorylase [Methanomicrobium sp. W14]